LPIQKTRARILESLGGSLRHQKKVGLSRLQKVEVSKNRVMILFESKYELDVGIGSRPLVYVRVIWARHPVYRNRNRDRNFLPELKNHTGIQDRKNIFPKSVQEYRTGFFLQEQVL
jgi:hypothetical protein